MTLNVRLDETKTPERADRQHLADELLDELTGWSPRERLGMFKAWHQGALSLVHLSVLALLEEGPRSMRGLADALDVSDASATGIVDRMVRRGLVKRQHGTDDRRVVVVALTEEGAGVFRQIAGHHRERLGRLLGELTDEELSCLLTGVRAMHAARTRLLADLRATQPGAGPTRATLAEPDSFDSRLQAPPTGGSSTAAAGAPSTGGSTTAAAGAAPEKTASTPPGGAAVR